MQRRTLALTTAVLPALASVLAAPASAAPIAAAGSVKAPTRAVVTVLPAVDAVNQPVGITDAGLVVGNAGATGSADGQQVYVNLAHQPWRWIAGRLQRLPTGGAAEAGISAVNRLGVASGETASTVDADGGLHHQRAAEWDVLGRAHPIGVVAAAAPALNDQGDLLLWTAPDDAPPSTSNVLQLAVLKQGTLVPVDPAFDLLGSGSHGIRLTDRGDVVYEVGGPSGTENFFRWRPGTASTQIGFGWPRFNAPSCVSANDLGLVAANDTDGTHAHGIELSRPDGTAAYLDPGTNEAAFLGCTGHAVNEVGDVTGAVWSVYEPGASIRPVVWRNGVLHGLGDGSTSGTGVAVNDLGQVAGLAHSGSGEQDPVLWTGNSTLKLPIPSGWTLAGVTQVNDRGQVLGAIQRTTATGAEQVRAVVWTTS